MSGGEYWYDYIESLIFSKVQSHISQYNEAEVFCTTEAASVSGTTFPCVYIHELEGNELGQDLWNHRVAAVMYNMQIDVYAKSKTQAKKLMRYALTKMKELCFNVSTMPIVLQENVDVYHSVARFRRVIAAGDTI